MKKYTYFFISFFIYFGCFSQPGKNGALTVSSTNQILNQYMPVSVNIAAGSSVVTIANSSLFSICPGDLIMIYQAQGANMDITNTISYGNILAYNSAGLYEFKYVQSVSGNNVTTQTTFTNSYVVAGRVQLIKVPQYTNLTVNAGASIVPKPWKDTTIAATPYRFGGLVVLHATNIINNGSIIASGSGFRGGIVQGNGPYIFGPTNITSPLIINGGEKGEGIFGYQIDYDSNGGRYCKGAPANGGGGATSTNAGGGGGANGNNGNAWTGQGIMIVNANNPLAAWSLDPAYIANGNALTNSSGGGRGGYSVGGANANPLTTGPGNPAWGLDLRRDMGGRGGRPLTNINSETRIYFGGGGGAGDANNAAGTSGGNGGGIVYLIATTGITGNGNIITNGNSVGNTQGCHCDGSGGAGAGGSVIIKSSAIVATQIVTANGGIGGSQLPLAPPGGFYESEGPGGGGGGGFVAISSGAVIPQVNGGLNGTSQAAAVVLMTFNGSTQGATGQIAPVSNAFVSFTPIITPPISGTTMSVCAGSVLNLTTTVGASTYFWSGPNSFTSAIQNPSISNVTAIANGVYTVTQNFSGCLPPTAFTTTVSVISSPTITLSNTVICSGQTINLNPTINTATSYTWAGPNSFSANTPSISIPNALPNTTGSYTLTGSNVSGCISTAIANVTVVSTPTPVLLSNSPVCAGSSLNFTTSGATSYTLSGPNAFTSNLINPIINNVSLAATGVYTLTAGNNGCTAITNNTVSINAIPTITLNANSFCSGQSVSLNPSVASATAFSWVGPNGFNASTQNFTITNSTPAATGLYSITATSIGGCTATANTSVSVIATPTPVLNSNSPVCSGATLNFTTSGATTYTLDGPNGFSSTLQNPAITNVSVLGAGIYTLIANNSTCSATTNNTVSINAIPTITLNTNSFCSGQSVILNPSVSSATAFSWVGPNGFNTSTQNFTITNSTPAEAGMYTLTVTNINGCSSIASVSIAILQSPTINITGSSGCINQPLNINCITNGSSFLWSGPNGFSSVAQNINFSAASFSLSGAYNLTVTSAQGCTNTAVASVSVYPIPTPSLSSNSPVCVGGTLNLIASGGNTYFYTGPNGFTSTLQNPSINNVAAATAGIYTLTASNFGCSASITLPVSIFGSGIGTLTVSDNEKCIPFCSSFSINTSGSPAISASISINGQLFIGNPVNYCLTTAGNYTIKSTFKDGSGCISTSSIQLTGYPKPNADFVFSPLKPIENVDEVIFTNTSTGINQTNWNWFFNDSSGFTSANQNTFYMYQNAGTYPVAMIVKNGWGCADTVIKIITIGNEYNLYVPNAFTPDGDGLNDIFSPKGTGITKYELTIFDRWGELLFTSNDFFKGWDGTFKGQPCKTDTYTWKINVNDPESGAKEYVGHVTLYK